MGNKRANGEGSIYRKRDRLWCGQFVLPTGKRRTVYGKTRREVVQKLAELQCDPTHASYPGRATLGQFITRFDLECCSLTVPIGQRRNTQWKAANDVEHGLQRRPASNRARRRCRRGIEQQSCVERGRNEAKLPFAGPIRALLLPIRSCEYPPPPGA